MKYGRKVSVSVFFLTLLVMVSGCRGKGNSAENAAERKTVVTIWTKDRHDAAYQESRVKEYNDTNEDNIVVDYRIYSDNYLQALDSAFQTNSAPDLIAYTDQVFYRFYARDYFADIMPYMDEEFQKSYSSVMVEGVNLFENHCYFIPTCATTPRLFYNKTLFRKAGISDPPATMEEMIEVAKKITSLYAEEGIYGFAVNMKNAKSALDRSLLEEANKEIGIKSGYDFKNGCYDFTGYEQILTNWRTLLSPDCAYPYCSELDIDPLRQMFADGKIGMYISYIHSEAGVYQKQFPMEDEWGCAEIPTAGGMQEGAQNYSLNNGFLMNKNCENPEAVWKAYCALFGSLDYQKEYYENGFGVSIIPRIIEEAKQEGYAPEYETLILGENDKMWPKTPLEENGEAVVVDGLDFYETFKELLFNQEKIAPALEQLTEKYNRAYRQGIRQQLGREIKIIDFDPANPANTVEGKDEK